MRYLDAVPSLPTTVALVELEHAPPGRVGRVLEVVRVEAPEDRDAIDRALRRLRKRAARRVAGGSTTGIAAPVACSLCFGTRRVFSLDTSSVDDVDCPQCRNGEG